MNLRVAFKVGEPPKEYPIKRFESLFGITYLKELTFADWSVEQWIRKKCARAKKAGKVGELSLWLGKLHQQQLRQGAIPNVAICWMHEKIGYGLFATAPFKKWEYIGEYAGLLRRRSRFFPNINDYCFMYPREWIAWKAHTIDSQDHGNYTRFINHSDDPNCESISVYYNGIFRILFRTIKKIPTGEELTYDYGEIYWQRRKKLDNHTICTL